MEPRAGKSQSPAGPVDHGQSPAGRSMSRGGRRGGSARAPATCARAAPRPVMTSTTAPALDGARQPVARPLAAVPAAPSPRPDPESPRGGDSRPPPGRHMALVSLRRPLGNWARRPRPWFVVPEAGSGSPGGGAQSPAGRSTTAWFAFRGATAPALDGPNGRPGRMALVSLRRPLGNWARRRGPGSSSPRPDPGARAGERNRLQAGRPRPPRSGVPRGGIPAASRPPRGAGQTARKWAVRRCPRREPGSTFRGARLDVRSSGAARPAMTSTSWTRRRPRPPRRGPCLPRGDRAPPSMDPRQPVARPLAAVPAAPSPGRGTAIACRPVDHGPPRSGVPEAGSRPPHGRHVALVRPLGSGRSGAVPAASLVRPSTGRASMCARAPARPWFVVPEAGSGARGGGAQSPAGRSTTARRAPGVPAASRPPRGAGQTARKWAVGAGQTARKWAVRAQVLSTTAAGGAPESPRRDPGLPHGRHMGAGQTARKWAVRRLGSTFRGARSRSSRAQSEAGSGSPGGGSAIACRPVDHGRRAPESPRRGDPGRLTAATWRWSDRSEVGAVPAAALGIAAAGDEPARAGPGADHGPPARSLVRLPRGLPRPPSMAHGSRSHVVDVRWQPFQPRPVRGRIREPGRGSAIACRPVDHGRRAPESPRRDPGLPHGRHMALVRPLGSGRSGGLVRPSAGRAPRCARSSGAATAPALDGARPHGAGQPAQAARKLGAPARPWFVVPEAGSGARAGKP